MKKVKINFDIHLKIYNEIPHYHFVGYFFDVHVMSGYLNQDQEGHKVL